MHLTLYSFRICPFVERINILLDEKAIPCERVQVDIRNKPAWFGKISPLGKVPVLKVDDTVLFESSVTSEFLDEISSPSLQPTSALQRALNRSWIEWGSTLIMAAYHMTLAPSKEEFLAQQKIVEAKLSLLEASLQNQPFFNGEAFCLIDIAYAPLFRRMDCLKRLFSIELLAHYPKVLRWAQQVLARPTVQKGFVADFDAQFRALLCLKESCLV